MSEHETEVAEALEAAERWLALVDAGDYGGAWDTAAALMKGAIGRDALSDSLRGARAPFGAVKSRAPTAKTYATSLPGAPDGEYVVIQMATSFEHKQQAGETITPKRDPDGSWRVSGYFIQ